MSLGGIRALRGSAVTVRRATASQKAEADEQLTWATVGSAGVQVRIETLSLRYQKMLEREYGADVKADRMVFFDAAQDVRREDGLIVTAGTYNGEHLKVQVVLPRATHIEAAVQVTPETFA